MDGDATELFQGDQHADLYTKYRPKIPKAIVTKIINFLSAKKSPPYDLALDIACGSGQSTGILSNYFKNVLGVDVSEALIENAIKNNTVANVAFKVGIAESLPVTDCSVDLITAANAIHWFDTEPFMVEANRVLKPGGVIALYGYGLAMPIYKDVSDELYEIVQKHFFVTLANYWNKKAALPETSYQNISVPFAKETLRDLDGPIYDDVEGTVADLCGLIETWSGSQTFKKQNPELYRQVMQELEKSFLEVMQVSSRDTKLILRWKYYMLFGRKPL